MVMVMVFKWLWLNGYGFKMVMVKWLWLNGYVKWLWLMAKWLWSHPSSISDMSSSCAEEGIFRVSRSHEPTESVSDISGLDECILIQDDAFPSMTDRGNMLNAASEFHCSSYQRHHKKSPVGHHHYQHYHHSRRPRRFSETLRIVLRTENQEAHLWLSSSGTDFHLNWFPTKMNKSWPTQIGKLKQLLHK